MLDYALSLLLGIGVFSFKENLTISSLEWVLFFTLLMAIFALFKRHQHTAISLIIFLIGFIWMGYYSSVILKQKIDDIYLHKAIDVVGKIGALPKISNQKTQFIFNAESPFLGRLKLSWYGKKLPKINNGDTWTLRLKLKHNNSYQNRAGFDYEKWLFYNKIDATGYVRESSVNQLIKKSNSFSINKMRQELRDFLQSFLSNLKFGGVINALIIGDRSLIDKDNWMLFKATNTTHLSVISGLHIGLVAGLVFLLSSFFWRRCKRCAQRFPAQIIGSYFGLISALLYALMAGFSVPTQRAFIMSCVVFLAIIFRRHHATWQLFGIALIGVLIFNPLSIFSVGFWLSFYVVGVIIYTLQHYRSKYKFYQIITLQIGISVATLPLIAWFFNTGSLFSPIANWIAIPVFSFITVPISLIGTLFALLGLDFLADMAFFIANQALIYLSYLLIYLKNMDINLWHYTPVSAVDLSLLLLAIFILFLPKQLKFRSLSILLLVLVFFSPVKTPEQNSALVTVLDVGQGLSIVVQTKNHVLLFDTGASYPSGFNMGEAVINPYLQSKHIKHLDKIIISHGDNDHIGGLKSVLNTVSVGELSSSVPNQIKQNAKNCVNKKPWIWDGVLFEILNTNQNFKGNNQSCVLKITTRKYSILLSADIEKKAEEHLFKTFGDKLRSDVLIVPHHGSKTSSTPIFLHSVQPKLAVISSGYKNRFNHPATEVMDRYRHLNIKTLNTNCSGQIDIDLANTITVHEYRKIQGKYYTRQCAS